MRKIAPDLYLAAIRKYVQDGGYDPYESNSLTDSIARSVGNTTETDIGLTKSLFSIRRPDPSSAEEFSINSHLNKLAADFFISCSKFGLFQLPSVYVGWSPDMIAEGRAFRLSDGYLITLSSGLTLLHSYIGRLLMRNGSITVEVGDRVYENLIPPNKEEWWELGRRIGDALLGFVTGNLPDLNHIPDDFSVKGIAAKTLPIWANKFIIGHEICHILLGHLGSGDPDKLSRFRNFAFSPPLPRAWEAEVHSDIYALQILACPSSRDGMQAAAGGLLALHIDRALWSLTGIPSFRSFFEWYYKKELPDLTTTAAESSGEYPPPGVRIGILIHEAQKLLDTRHFDILMRYQASFESGITQGLAYAAFLSEKILERAAGDAPGGMQ